MATTTAKPGKPAASSTTISDAMAKLSNAAKGWWSKPYNGNSSPGLIAHYWLAAGGNPKYVNQAVAAALAESGGSGGARSAANSNGTYDVGYWQINTVHGPGMASTDPLTNARAAIHLSKNGTDWSPWCTSYSDGMCHGSTSDPHYKGAGKGNRLGGSAVLGQAALGFLYAKDAMAGAFYGANSAGGAVVGLNTPFEPVDSSGVPLSQKATDAVNGALGVNDLSGAASTITNVLGGGTVGKVLAYAGYGLLAAFGATLMVLALAILTLALVERQQALAALPGVGKFAGAASEVSAGVQARGVRNQSRGASAFRSSAAGRKVHGEPKGPAPKATHGGERRARRVHAGPNDGRYRPPKHLPARKPAPF